MDYPDTVSPIPRQTLEEEVYGRLCRLILQGGIMPGELITVTSLAEGFAVSPMPVRKALARLSAAGAVAVVSGRTVGIPKLTRERLDELERVRLVVEPTAAAWAAERKTPQFIEILASDYQNLVESERSQDTKRYLQSNYDFHFRIYRQSASPIMNSIIEHLWLQISPYFHLLRASGNFQIANRHHGAIYQAMTQGDAEGARKALEQDIKGAYEVLRKLL